MDSTRIPRGKVRQVETPVEEGQHPAPVPLIEFSFLGKQVSWSRARGTTHRWNLTALTAWESTIHAVAEEEVAMAGYTFPACGVQVSVEMETPSLASFGDPDRHLNAVLDGLRGVLYPDDKAKFLRGAGIWVHEGPEPRTTITCYSA